MFAAFKERRPWASVLITFVFDPFIGMLYLNRWPLSLLYFVLENLTIGILAYFTGLNALLSGIALLSLALTFRVIGSIHAYSIARKRVQTETIHWYARLYSVIGILILFIAGRWAFAAFLYQPFNIPSGSMSPTLNVGDNFFASKSAYMNAPPQRGDVVIFHVPREWNVLYTKRIIGAPGDRVQFVKGIVYINGRASQLHDLGTFPIDCTAVGCTNAHQYAETFPGERAHRILRIDGIDFSENTGVFAVPASSYFVAGDNRDNSRDSRSDDFGFVPARAIVGKVAIKYFDGVNRRWVWQTVD
jgi:signal peptidase I